MTTNTNSTATESSGSNESSIDYSWLDSAHGLDIDDSNINAAVEKLVTRTKSKPENPTLRTSKVVPVSTSSGTVVGSRKNAKTKKTNGGDADLRIKVEELENMVKLLLQERSKTSAFTAAPTDTNPPPPNTAATPLGSEAVGTTETKKDQPPPEPAHQEHEGFCSMLYHAASEGVMESVPIKTRDFSPNGADPEQPLEPMDWKRISTLAMEKAKSTAEEKWKAHQNGLVQQVHSMDLTEKFSLRTAYMIAIFAFAAKLAYVSAFASYHQAHCTTSTSVVNADKDPQVYDSMFSKASNQFICSSYALNGLNYKYKAMHWMQEHSADFGSDNPREYVDFSPEDFPYVWTGLQGLVVQSSPLSSNPEENLNPEENGWHLYTGIYYANHCALQCSNDGYTFGFWAEQTYDQSNHCWCSDYHPDNSCLLQYERDFPEANEGQADGYVSTNDLTEDQKNTMLSGFNGTQMASFFNAFENYTQHVPRTGCLYRNNTASAKNSIGGVHHNIYAWGNKAYASVPLLVFSQHPLRDFKTCNPEQANQACDIDASRSMVAGQVAYSVDTSLNRTLNVSKPDDTKITLDDYWLHCTLPGFECKTDYQNEQCGPIRRKDGPYCGVSGSLYGNDSNDTAALDTTVERKYPPRGDLRGWPV